MIYPKFINKNDVLAVTAPSSGLRDDIDFITLENAKSNLKKIGYNIIETDNVRKNNFCLSDTPKNVANIINDLYTNKDIKSIFAVSGGEFMCMIMPYIDFDNIKNNPKWFQGYSDNTWLTYSITTKLDIATIYSNNFKAFGMESLHSSITNNLKILEGNIIIQNNFDKYESIKTEKITGLETYNLDQKVEWKNLYNNEIVEFKGRIIGGCIDILNDLFGTEFDNTLNFIEKYKNDGIIWYFDNCELTIEQLIRTLHKFKVAGYFKYTNGIIFGRNIELISNCNIEYSIALKSILSDLNIPVILDVDIGHIPPRMTIINGSLATISYNNGKGYLKQELI